MRGLDKTVAAALLASFLIMGLAIVGTVVTIQYAIHYYLTSEERHD